MSRGPGRWQRLILEAVEADPASWVTTDDVLLMSCARVTLSDRQSVRRAMHRLAELGVVELRHQYSQKRRRVGGLPHLEAERPGGVTMSADRVTLAVRTVD